MQKLRWGILSTSKFALEKIVPAMRHCEHAMMTAVASRDIERARRFADDAQIERTFDSYEALLDDPEIDVVYIPLPNHLHIPLSISALRAGKHVLCEKPVGLSSAEAQLLLDESYRHPKLKVMEAFMYRFHPQWQRAKKITRSGGIGELRTIQSFFSYFNLDRENIRNRADIGGGAMLDIGCYCVSLSRFIFGSEPEHVSAVIEKDPVFGTDRRASVILKFAAGTSVFSCSTQLAPYQRVNILGTKGRIELEIPFNAPPDRPTRIWHETSSGIEEITFGVCDQYTIQGDLFSLAVIHDTHVPTPLEDAVANMRVVDGILATLG